MPRGGAYFLTFADSAVSNLRRSSQRLLIFSTEKIILLLARDIDSQQFPVEPILTLDSAHLELLLSRLGSSTHSRGGCGGPVK
jgi:hypothetical protein